MTDTTVKGWPFLDQVHVDGTTVLGDGTPRHPLRAPAPGMTLDLPNGEAFPLVPGQAVTSLGDSVRLAKASSSAHSTVIGIVLIGAAPTLLVTIAPIGAVMLSTEIWDAVTGQIGGLSADTTYYLDAIPGHLTTTPPTAHGTYLVAVGRGLTPIIFSVFPTAPVLL